MRTFIFGRGGHDTREDGMCVMEAAAYIADEKHTDMPECSDFWISRVCQRLNDCCNNSYRNERLQELPWRVVGTNNKDFSEIRRQMVVDFVVSRFNWPILEVEKFPYVYISMWINVMDTSKNRDAKCDEVLDLIDRMIKLTEIKEEVVQRQKEFV